MAPVTRSRGPDDSSIQVSSGKNEVCRATAKFGQEQADLDEDMMDSGYDEGMSLINSGPRNMAFSVSQPLINLTEDAPVSESSIHDFLKPLQETADRLSKQVEDFASRLHRYKTDRAANDQILWDDALALLTDLEAITRRRLEETDADRPRAFSHRQSVGDTEALLDRLDLEADLWQLTRRLLANESPASLRQTSAAQDDQMKSLNRYSTNSDLWNAFMDSDPVAQQYEATLDWLQERANTTSPPINDIIHNMTLKSERGEGVWSAGPIFTRNAIKKQKRLRAWPSPLSPGDGGLDKSHRRADDAQPVVAQLDPDAATREDAVLEVQDESYEQAAWVTYWELLRRGRTIADIRSWWDERNEQWRAVLLNATYPGSDNSVKSPWLRMMNSASNPSWTACCKSLANNSVIDDPFQKGVYALLAGETGPSALICDTVDDYMFIEHNSLLIQRFDAYLHAFRTPTSRNAKYLPPADEQDRIRSAIRALEQKPDLDQEMQDPYKAVEMALMSKRPGHFFSLVGRAAAQVARSQGDKGHWNESSSVEEPPISPVLLQAVRDEDCVRFITHLQLILSALDSLQNAQQAYLENNIINFIGWLQRNRKWSLLPIYASKLSKPTVREVLGRILTDITNEKERNSSVRLMRRYHIDVSDVVEHLVSLAAYEKWGEDDSRKEKKAGLPRITEREGPERNRQSKIKTDFMCGEDAQLTEVDARVCSAVEWYQYVTPQYWKQACADVSMMFRRWLLEGNFAALKQLTRSASLSTMSLAICNVNLNFADDMEDGANGTSDTHAQDHAPSATSRRALYEDSLNWRQLEQLVLALEQLEQWQNYADACET
jgi:nuclear pore complex protein Nup107